MRFVVNEVELEQVFIIVFFGFPLLINIPPFPHTHRSPCHEVCDLYYETAPYHQLDPKFGPNLNCGTWLVSDKDGLIL